MEVKKELIEACIKGERPAQYTLYKIMFSYLMSICIRYTRDSGKAEEMLNQGFYKILINLDKYDASGPLKPWARKIMINTLINAYKKEKHHQRNLKYVEQYAENESYAELNAAITKISTAQIKDFIRKLPPLNQQVFNLYFIDGYSHKEIAQMLSIPEGTSRWHLNVAREKLKQILQEVYSIQKIKS